MKAVIPMGTLQAILKALVAIDRDGIVGVGPDGWKIKVVDPANVAMVAVDVPAGAFEYYNADIGEIAFDFLQLQDLLSGKEPVSLEIEEQSLSLRTGKFRYKTRLLAPSSIKPAPRIPSIDLPCSIEIDALEWGAALKAAEKILTDEDSLSVSQDDDSFSLSADTKVESFQADWPLAELTGIRQGIAKSNIALNYLLDTAKPLAGKVQVETGLDYPLRLTCHIGKVTIEYMIAPRLEQDA